MGELLSGSVRREVAPFAPNSKLLDACRRTVKTNRSPLRLTVSFRQACMNFPEAVGIVGCPLNCGRRITDENQENNHFRQSL